MQALKSLPIAYVHAYPQRNPPLANPDVCLDLLFEHAWLGWSVDTQCGRIHMFARRVFPTISHAAGYRVALESSVKGFGLQATRVFKAGEMVMPVEGIVGPFALGNIKQAQS